MAAHDHQAAHGGAAPAAASAPTSPLERLVELLMEDPAVRARIGEDPELRSLLNDPALPGRAAEAAGAAAGMAGVLQLVGELLQDPAVRARVEADPALRELWSTPAVRQQILPTGGPR